MDKVLFWDFDGTIIHPNESFLDSMRTALESNYYKLETDDIKRYLRTVCTWYTPEISYTDKIGQEWWNLFFKHFTLFYENNNIAEKDRDKINQKFKYQILDYINYTPYTDSESTLYKCKEQGYKNYILSNNFPELPLVIKGLKLSEYFNGYVVSSNVGYEKPRKELFQFALSIAGFPDCCYMIGDNPIADIIGGKSAGMKSILVHKDCYSDADYTCKNLLDIPELLI